jgi:hypothetical protein
MYFEPPLTSWIASKVSPSVNGRFLSCVPIIPEHGISVVGSNETFAAAGPKVCDADLDEAALAAMVLVAGVLR